MQHSFVPQSVARGWDAAWTMAKGTVSVRCVAQLIGRSEVHTGSVVVGGGGGDGSGEQRWESEKTKILLISICFLLFNLAAK